MRSPSHHQRLVCLLRRQPGSSRGFPLFNLAGLPSRGQLAEIPAWGCRATGVGQRLVQKPKTFLYRCLKKIDTGAFKQDLLTLSHKSVLSVTTITISVLSLTSTPLSAVARSVQGSRRPGSAVLRSSSVS